MKIPTSQLTRACVACFGTSILNLAIPMSSALAEVDWQAQSEINWSQQSFADLPSAQQTQLQLTSLWRATDWDLRFSVPLLKTDEDFQIQPGKTPNLCARIANATPTKLARWLRNGRVKQTTVDRCLAQTASPPAEQATGVGDVSLEINHYWTPNNNLDIQLGSGVKAANGDENKNLGTGRESVYLTAGVTYLWTQVTGSINARYDRHLGAGETDELNASESISAHLDWQWREDLSVGVFSRWDSALFSDEDNLASAGISLSYQPVKRLTLGINVEHYQANSQNLQQVVAGSIAYTAW